MLVILFFIYLFLFGKVQIDIIHIHISRIRIRVSLDRIAFFFLRENSDNSPHKTPTQMELDFGFS